MPAPEAPRACPRFGPRFAPPWARFMRAPRPDERRLRAEMPGGAAVALPTVLRCDCVCWGGGVAEGNGGGECEWSPLCICVCVGGGGVQAKI
jgi:hypothetical protein